MPNLPGYLNGQAVGREPVSRQVLAEHQRERVVAAAIPVFAQRGYRVTTVDDLLAAGKVGVGNFYALFDGKQDCFMSAFERISSDVRERVESERSGTTDWAQRTYLGLRSLLGFLIAEPLSARLVLVEAQSCPAAIARYEAFVDEAIDWLGKGRSSADAGRQLPPSFERASVAGLAFYLQHCLVDSSLPPLANLLTECGALIFEPLAGSAEVPRLKALSSSVSS